MVQIKMASSRTPQQRPTPVTRSIAQCVCLLGIVLWGSDLRAFTPHPHSPMATHQHPRLHMTADTIPALRDALAAHYAERFQRYIDWIAKEDVAQKEEKYNIISDAGHDLMRALMVHQAFVGALGPVPGIQYPYSLDQFARKAINRLLAQLRDGRLLSYVGVLVYDWTYNFMTDAERQESTVLLAARKIKHNHPRVNVSVTNPVFEPVELFSSLYYESFFPWYAGLALWGEAAVHAEAARAVETFQEQMLNFGHLDAINFAAGDGGGWDEWIGYANWHPRAHALLIDAWHTATGQNFVAADTPTGNALKHYPKFVHYAVDPHKYYDTTYTYVMMGGAQTTDTVITGNASQQSLLFFLPRMLDAADLPLEAGLVNHFLATYGEDWNSPYRFHDLWAFLGLPHTQPPVTPQQVRLPKSNYSENIGLFLARTGFDSAADSVFFVSDSHFRFTPSRGVQGWPGFGLVKFGPLTGTRNVAHRGYGNLSDYPGAYQMSHIHFDGGHKRSRDEIKNRRDLQQALDGQGDFDWGGIEQIITRDGVFYHLRLNRSRGFTDGVQHHREYVWLPGTDPTRETDFLVIYDRVAAPSTPHWVYHVPWRPEVEGDTRTHDLTLGSGLTGRIGTAYQGTQMVLTERNALGDEKDNHKGTADYTGGAGAHGVLFVRTVLPRKARIEVTRVAEFDKDVLYRQGNLAMKAHRWQVDVTPWESAQDSFLHVLQTADAHTTTVMAPTTLLQGWRVEGVFIERPAVYQPNFAVLFKKQDSNTTLMRYTLSGQGLVRHIVTGLIPDAVYSIEDMTMGTAMTQVTEKGRAWDYKGVDTNTLTGTLFFESTLSGTHQYRVKYLGPAVP